MKIWPVVRATRAQSPSGSVTHATRHCSTDSLTQQVFPKLLKKTLMISPVSAQRRALVGRGETPEPQHLPLIPAALSLTRAQVLTSLLKTDKPANPTEAPTSHISSPSQALSFKTKSCLPVSTLFSSFQLALSYPSPHTQDDRLQIPWAGLRHTHSKVIV